LPAVATASERAGLRAFCDQWVQYRPAPDVAYQPGVDVHGQAVAPADLPGSPGALGHGSLDRFEIPLSLDNLRQLRVAVPSLGRAIPGTLEVGRLVVEGNQVSLNGQPLTASVAEELAGVCGR